MAGEATIGAIRVVLGADTAKFEENLRSALGSLESFGKKIASVAAGVGIERAFEKAFSAIVESITSAIDAADKLAKASQKFGIPVEQLSLLSAAAELSDVSLDQLGSSLARLSKGMVKAGSETSDQAAAFRALGLSAKQLQDLSLEDTLLKIADKFSKFEDGAAKAAVSMALFRSTDLIPFLNQGAAGIKELTERMKGLGVQVDGPTAAAAEKFNDDLKLLAKAKDAIILRILGSGGMLEAMNKLTVSMQTLGSETNKSANTIGNVLGAVLKDAQKSAESFAESIKGLKDLPAALDDVEKGVQQHDMSAVLGNLSRAAKDLGFTTTEAAKRLRELSDVPSPEFAAMAAGMTAAATAAKDLGEKQKLIFDPEADKRLKAFNDELKKMHLQAVDASGVFGGQLAPGFLAATAGMEALKGQITVVGDQFVRLGPLATQFNQAMLQLEGAKLTAEFLTPWQQYEEQLKRINVLLANGAISSETFRAAAEKAAAAIQVAYTQVAQQIVTDFASAFKNLAAMNHQWAGIAKAAAIAQATVDTYASAQRAYLSAAIFGPEFGALAAGAAVAAGLANVAKISATQFAKGGSFRVPSGISGVDSRVMPLALSPGERVDITPSSQMRDRGGRAREIVVGMSMKDFLNGSNMRDLIDSLNASGRDGYRLRFSER